MQESAPVRIHPSRPHHRRTRLSGFLALVFLAAAPLLAQLPAGTSDASEPATAANQPGHADPRRLEAGNALDHQDYATALKLLSSLAAENPKDARTQYDLAYTQESMGDTASAASSYRRASEDDPTFFEPHLALGLLLARTGKLPEARTELLAATKLTPSTDPTFKARAWRTLARVDEQTHPDEARDALLEALKISPETPDDTLLSAELAEQAHDPAAAETAYRRLLAAKPEDPQASAALGHLLSNQNKLPEAEALLVAASTAHPDDVPVNSELATVYSDEGKDAQAIASLRKVRAANQDDEPLTRLYARLLSRTGDYATAEPIWNELSSAHPNDPTLLDDWADALIHLHRYAEAEGLLKRALAQPAAFPTREDLGGAASHLAFAASENNDPETTLQALAVRATVLPPSPSALFLEATAHDKLHHVKQASELYKQFLSVADNKFPNEEWQARHRLITLEHAK